MINPRPAAIAVCPGLTPKGQWGDSVRLLTAGRSRPLARITDHDHTRNRPRGLPA